MPKKQRFTPKEHRQIDHIIESEESRGHSEADAKAIGYATVTKQTPEKQRYSAKEKRQVQHVIESEEARGKSEDVATRIAYGTVNKHH
jgi:hypothetical protein